MNVASRFVVFLTLYAFIHVGCVFGQKMAVFALSGDADYGSTIIAGTPIEGLLAFSRIISIFNLRELFTAFGGTLTDCSAWRYFPTTCSWVTWGRPNG